MEPETQIQVSSSAERQAEKPTARQQIETVLERAQERGDPLRIRLPFTLWEYSEKKTYVTLREAVWLLTVPSEGVGGQSAVDAVEELIQAMDAWVKAVGSAGAGRMLKALRMIEAVTEEEQAG
jgi:uridine phosphorylase